MHIQSQTLLCVLLRPHDPSLVCKLPPPKKKKHQHKHFSSSLRHAVSILSTVAASSLSLFARKLIKFTTFTFSFTGGKKKRNCTVDASPGDMESLKSQIDSWSWSRLVEKITIQSSNSMYACFWQLWSEVWRWTDLFGSPKQEGLLSAASTYWKPIFFNHLLGFLLWHI